MCTERKINTVGKPVVSKLLVTQCLAEAIAWSESQLKQKLAVDQKVLARHWQTNKLSH